MKAHRFRVVLLTLILGLQSDILRLQLSPVVSLAIRETQVGDGHIVVTVRNASTRTITAWGIRGRVTFDGGATQHVGMVADGYESGFGGEPGAEAALFVPGATIRHRLGIKTARHRHYRRFDRVSYCRFC